MTTCRLTPIRSFHLEKGVFTMAAKPKAKAKKKAAPKKKATKKAAPKKK
jgi:hypothetical protein